MKVRGTKPSEIVDKIWTACQILDEAIKTDKDFVLLPSGDGHAMMIRVLFKDAQVSPNGEQQVFKIPYGMTYAAHDEITALESRITGMYLVMHIQRQLTVVEVESMVVFPGGDALAFVDMPLGGPTLD